MPDRVRHYSRWSVLEGCCELGVGEAGAEGFGVDAGAGDRGGLGGEVDGDRLDAGDGGECRLHSRGAPAASCHAGDVEGDLGGVSYGLRLGTVFAGGEGEAAESEEDEEKLLHGVMG